MSGGQEETHLTQFGFVMGPITVERIGGVMEGNRYRGWAVAVDTPSATIQIETTGKGRKTRVYSQDLKPPWNKTEIWSS